MEVANESDDVMIDQSEEPGIVEEPPIASLVGKEGEEQEEEMGCEMMKTSRPGTADRKTMSWEEAGGLGVKDDQTIEGNRMRRPSQQSLDGTEVSSYISHPINFFMHNIM